MAGRRCSKGTPGGGGGVLAITCGGILGAPAGGCARGSVRVLASGGAGRPAFWCGGTFLVSGGAFGFLATPGRSEPGAALAAVIGCGFRIGGAGTGFPGIAARVVGLTGGCGVTCALSICCGESLTA